MDPRRTPAGGSMGSRRPAQHAVSDQPQVPAGAGLGESRAAVRHALAVPPIRDGARRAQIGAARPAGRGRCVLRRGLRLGARQLVCPRRRRARNTNTATAARTGSSTAPREHRAVRTAVGLFDQSSFAKFRLEGRDAARVLEPRLRQRRRRGARQNRLHAVAERTRRHRGGPDRDALERDRLPDRQRRGNRNQGLQLAANGTSSRRLTAC